MGPGRLSQERGHALAPTKATQATNTSNTHRPIWLLVHAFPDRTDEILGMVSIYHVLLVHKYFQTMVVGKKRCIRALFCSLVSKTMLFAEKIFLVNFGPITGNLEMKFSKDSLTWTRQLVFSAPPEMKHTCDVHLSYRRVLRGGQWPLGCVFLTVKFKIYESFNTI